MWRTVGGVRSATVVTDTPCELFTLGLQKLHQVLGDDLAAPLHEILVLSCVKQSSVMFHFSSTQQLEIVRVMETSSHAAGESVPQDIRFCVVVDGDVSGSRGGRWKKLERGNGSRMAHCGMRRMVARTLSLTTGTCLLQNLEEVG